MPLPTEHSARMMNPDRFVASSFRRKNIAPGIDAIMGKMMGSSSMSIQSYRFDKTKYSPAQARQWMRDHMLKYISFESARQ